MRLKSCSLIVTICLLCGCSGPSDAPEMAAVEGTITWKGAPLSDASVAFTPSSGPVAVGVTDGDGKFRLTTQGRPGAAIGAHRVTIQAFEPLPPGKVTGPDAETSYQPASRIPAKFGELEQSGLQAVVTPKASENRFDFQLQ